MTQKDDGVAIRNTVSVLLVMATFGVLLVHVNQKLSFPGLIGEIASFGADGVKCFFYLTGLLVMASWQGRQSAKDYWRKRLARTLPVYYFFLLLFVVLRNDWLKADVWAFPRAVFMLQYVAPPTVSYEYCSMNLLGVLAIFMSFYIAIPFLAKWIHSLDGAFVGALGMVTFSVFLNKAYVWLYGSFCPLEAVQTMANYFCNSIPFFAMGVMAYFGKQEEKPLKLLAYCLFISICGMRYSFLGITETGWLCLLITILVCFPPRVLEKLPNVGRFDRVFGMGVFLSQFWCFELVNKISASFSLTKELNAALMLALPYCVAFVLHYLVEEPGAKAINWMFEYADKKVKT